MTENDHECDAIQPGESVIQWEERTHGGMGYVPPGSCPTCCAERAGIAPHLRERWIAGEAVEQCI